MFISTRSFAKRRIASFRTILLTVMAGFLAHVIAGNALAQMNPTGSASAAHFVAGSEDVYFDAAKLQVIAPALLSADKLSSNSIGNVVTFLFPSGQISAQTDADPLIATWVGTIQIPVRAEAKPAKSYLQHIRGSVTKSEDARVSLVFELGGKRFVTEFPYGIKHQGELMRSFVSPVKPAMGPRYTATILIYIERRDAKSIAAVDIDSLDIEVKPSTKVAKR